ncbi:hypothetical protein [Acinetobacter tandoii]|uniref:Uncharacterized protein n=1 Tax=Acinetobacter tandoii DSM 14970 = CIP 107469 TaxID=1120927 RepID=R9B1T4_9GAMM|nr:hypothetical protein [Acinetobacter tandoii]EOR08240.1 hypothetical protein I593_01595 [Acinetobacter tandoii DSM 14970 = CIP 107469]
MITLFQAIVISFAFLLCTALIAGMVWALMQAIETYGRLTEEAKQLQLRYEILERENAQIR